MPDCVFEIDKIDTCNKPSEFLNWSERLLNFLNSFFSFLVLKIFFKAEGVTVHHMVT